MRKSQHVSSQLIKYLIQDKINPKINKIEEIKVKRSKKYAYQYLQHTVDKLVKINCIKNDNRFKQPKINQQKYANSSTLSKHIKIQRSFQKKQIHLSRCSIKNRQQYTNIFQHQSRADYHQQFSKRNKSLIQLKKQSNKDDQEDAQINNLRQIKQKQTNFNQKLLYLQYPSLKKFGRYPHTYDYNAKQILFKQKQLKIRHKAPINLQISASSLVKKNVKTVHIQSNGFLKNKKNIFQKLILHQNQQNIWKTDTLKLSSIFRKVLFDDGVEVQGLPQRMHLRKKQHQRNSSMFEEVSQTNIQ